jgi:hypothetical protein
VQFVPDQMSQEKEYKSADQEGRGQVEDMEVIVDDEISGMRGYEWDRQVNAKVNQDPEEELSNLAVTYSLELTMVWRHDEEPLEGCHMARGIR